VKANGVSHLAKRFASTGILIDSGEIQARLLKRGAEYFALLAKRQTPPPLDPLMAQLSAEICAKLAGREVPKPGVGTSRVGGSTATLPEASTMMQARGFKRVNPLTAMMFSQFIANPNASIKASDLAERVGRSRANVSQILFSLAKFNCIERIERGAYRLAR
jgi:hypothetical protein